MNSMVPLESKVDTINEKLVEKLDSHAGQTMDLGHWLQLWAFGVQPNLFLS